MTITSLAGTTVMMPAGATCMAWLIWGGAWRLALWWCALFSTGLALVAASKIAFIGWGIGIQALDFAGFSGHAMRATAVLPVLLYLILQTAPRAVRIAGVVIGLAFGAVIGVSRLVVHAHSISEAVAGCLLGAFVSLVFIRIATTLPKPQFNRWIVSLGLVALVFTPMAEPAPTERWLQSIALYLSGHDEPFVRATAWH